MIDRRSFFKICSSAFVYSQIVNDFFASNNSKSIVWELGGTSSERINKLFEAVLDINSSFNKELNDSTVLIKPNLCLPHSSEMGTTTSPDIIHALLDYLSSRNVKRIIIADHVLQKPANFNDIELQNIVQKYPQARLVFANQRRNFKPVNVNGKVLKKTEILKLIDHADIFINIAAAKHHSATNVSLAIKNLMGVIWDRAEFHTKMDLSQAIADLALIVKPNLNIIDADRVLLNRGPTGPGTVINDKKLFASFDIVALDSIVASRYKFGGRTLSAKQIPHLWASYQNGIGEITSERINLIEL